jgi:glycosyltransferase involved in cell wall biosynthesis
MMYQSLEMLFREFTFDLAHSFFLYPVGYVTGLIAKRTGAPHITTIVGNDVKRYIFSPEKVAVCRSGLENADRVAALSVDLMEMADALSPCREKTRIIYNSVEIPTVLPKPVSRPLVIGCAGIFKYAKGLPYLFKAVERVREAHDVRLRIAGRVRPDEKPVVQAMLDRTGIADIVEFSGTVPHDAMSEWLSGLDVFTLPSLTEGCPNALMEAMAVGLPCVATDTGACSSLIEHGISGLIVPWANSEALAEAVSRVCADRDFAAGLGVAARSRAQRFSPARERACWGAIYKELVAF